MAELSVSAMPVELVTTEIVEEEVPNVMGSPAINAGAVLAVVDVLVDEAIREVEVPAMASLLAVQAMAKVLLAIVELLVIETLGDMAGEVGVHGEATTFMVASLGMVCLAGILPVVTGDSSSSQLHDFLPCTS